MGGTGRNAQRDGLVYLIELADRENRPIWLDTSALIAYLQQSGESATVLASLVEHPAILCGISTVTLAETLAGPARSGDELAVRRLRNELLGLPRFVVQPLDIETATVTAWIRVQTRLPLPDAGIIAPARLARAVCIIGNDRRWRGKSIGIPFLLLDDLRP